MLVEAQPTTAHRSTEQARPHLTAEIVPFPAPVTELQPLPEWKRRPKRLRPFDSFAEGMQAYEKAQAEWSAATKARVTLSAPFIDSGPNQQTIAYTFSRTVDEALEKCPDLPADLVEANRAEIRAQEAAHAVRRRLIQTPAHGPDILKKLRLIIDPIDDVLNPEDPRDVRCAQAHPAEFERALEFFALRDDIVRLAGARFGADPGVLSLLTELRQRWAAEKKAATDTELDDVVEASGQIARQIMALPGASLPNLRAKAEAVLWAFNTREEFDSHREQQHISTAEKYAMEIVSNLLSLPITSRAAPDLFEVVDARNRVIAEANRGGLPEENFAALFDQADELEARVDGADLNDIDAVIAKAKLTIARWDEGIDTSADMEALLRRCVDMLAPSSGAVQ